jgi:glycosyltransferase involved in cell wall biosynthesis
MVIAVNTRFLLKDKLEGYGYFIRELFTVLTRQHPEHQFYFLFDRPFDPSFEFPANVECMVVPPPARHPLLWKYWYDLKLPGVLKRIKADVFVSPDGICSLTTRVPQCLVIHDIGIIHYPADYKKEHYLFYKRYIPSFLKKAARIATVSGFSKNDIVKRYGTDPAKIDVVYNGVKEVFRPVEPSMAAQVKDEFTGGLDYFLYLGAIQPRKNLINLLKAFSIFKKRQQSSMKLVITGRMAWKNESFLELMNTYKYRDEVVMTGYLEETKVANLLGSAYALVYPSLFEGFGVPVLEAMAAGIPALTSAKTSMEEIAGDAGLYFDADNFEDIAEKMMLIYKDESLRKRLVDRGRERASAFSWQQSAQLMWDCISKAVQKQG